MLTVLQTDKWSGPVAQGLFDFVVSFELTDGADRDAS
jgi:hypothetical protein